MNISFSKILSIFKTPRIYFASAVFSALSLPFCAQAYTVKDARGNEFEFSKPPRAASIVPSATECVFAVGAENYLVANSRFCRFPKEAKLKEKIGAYMDPDYEKIAVLKPEIFIIPNSADSRLEDRLRQIGIKCFVLNPEGARNIAKDVLLLGELFDKNENAKALAQKIENAISEAENEAGANSQKRPRAIFMFGKMAAGKGSYVGDIMEIAGFENCIISDKPWFVPSKESILSSPPELIFAESPDKKSFENALNFYSADPIWRGTPAVAAKKIFMIESDLISIPGPRIIETLEILKKIRKHLAENKN